MTSTLSLTKAHGLGNDFLMILESNNPGLRADPELAIALCDRHRGIGADGLMFGLAPNEPGADLTMVLFNADGSEAEISGNGIRCLGQAGLRARGEREGTIVIDGASGRRTLTATSTADPSIDLLSVSMGSLADGPVLGPAAMAVGALRRGSGSVGNPHVVLQVERTDDIDMLSVGAAIEAEVPGGTNVHALVVRDEHTIELRHWERGVGHTKACGSGATVAAALAHQWGVVSDRVTVIMPGGVATVDVGDPLVLTGEACHIADIEVLSD